MLPISPIATTITLRRGVDPKASANVLLGDAARLLKEDGYDSLSASTFTLPASATFVALTTSGQLTSKTLKDLLVRAFKGEEITLDLAKAEGLVQVSDKGEVQRFVDEVVAANAKTVEEIRKGKENALQFLKGQVMKASRGKANPALVEELLQEAIRNG